MQGLFFEMRPKPGHLDHYFSHVDRLRPVLAQHTGLAFLERYCALNDPDLILSHQLWADEQAISRWRQNSAHRRSQFAGQNVHFADYRIRVGPRIWHSIGGTDQAIGAHAPRQTCLAVVYGTAPVLDPLFDAYESVHRKGQFIALATCADPAAATALIDARGGAGCAEAAIYQISRDYGQFERAQAPQADDGEDPAA